MGRGACGRGVSADLSAPRQRRPRQRVSMQDYVKLQTAILLRRLAFQVSRAAKSTDHEAVHDLRVAVRRLNRCLRAFSQFYPGQSWKKVRHRLRDLMDAAGEV